MYSREIIACYCGFVTNQLINKNELCRMEYINLLTGVHKSLSNSLLSNPFLFTPEDENIGHILFHNIT